MFEYTYREYPNSPIATLINQLLSLLSTILVGMGLICIIVLFVVPNKLEALITIIVMIGLGFFLGIKKDDWTDKIASHKKYRD